MLADGISMTRLDRTPADRFQLLRRELGVTTFGMNLIVLRPGQRGRIHSHERQEEVFVVLSGRLTLVTEETERDLAELDAVRVAPSIRRQLINRGPADAVVLALGGATEHDGRDGIAYTAWDAADGAPPQAVPLPDDLPASELRRA